MDAKEIFYHCRGNRFLMERAGLLETYKQYHIPEQEEQQWIAMAVEAFLELPFYSEREEQQYPVLCEMVKKCHCPEKIITLMLIPAKKADRMERTTVLSMLRVSSELAVNCKRKKRIPDFMLEETTSFMIHWLSETGCRLADSSEEEKGITDVQEKWEGLCNNGYNH